MPLSRSAQTALLIFAVCLGGVNTLILAPILSDVALELATDTVTVSKAIVAFGTGAMLSALLLSPLVDRLGASLTLKVGLVVLAVSMALCAAATQVSLLIAAMAVAGAAAGLILPSSYVMAATVSEPGKEAITLGRVLGGWSLSMVGAVPLSALIADLANWRFAYGAVGLAALLLLLGVRSLPRSTVSTTATIVFPRTLRLLRNRPVAIVLSICFLFNVAFTGTYTFVIEQAKQVMEISSSLAAVMVLVFGLGFALAALLSFLVDRIGARTLLSLCLVMQVSAYLLLSRLMEFYPAYLAFGLFWGISNQFILTCAMTILTRSEPSRRGVAIGLSSVANYGGIMTGAMLAGLLFANHGFYGVTLMAFCCVLICVLVLGFLQYPKA